MAKANGRVKAFKSEKRMVATLVRNGDRPALLETYEDHYGFVRELEVEDDSDGCSIWAKAECGQEAYVCSLAEIPELIAWLKSVVDAKK